MLYERYYNVKTVKQRWGNVVCDMRGGFDWCSS